MCGIGRLPPPPVKDHSFTPTQSWVFGPSGLQATLSDTEPPAQWVTAIAAVRADVALLQTGSRANEWDWSASSWILDIDESGISIEVRDADNTLRVDTYRLGRVGRTAASATVWLARLVRANVASNLDVRWPVIDTQALEPLHLADDDAAMWMVQGTSITVAPIGTLHTAATTKRISALSLERVKRQPSEQARERENRTDAAYYVTSDET